MLYYACFTEERENLLADSKRLKDEVEHLRDNEAKREAGEILADKTAREMEALKQEKTDLSSLITKMEIENKKVTKDLQKAEKERDNVLARKEMVAGENMQLIVEAEAFHEVKSDLNNQLRSAQARVRELEKENHQMKFDFDSKMVDQQAVRTFIILIHRSNTIACFMIPGKVCQPGREE